MKQYLQKNIQLYFALIVKIFNGKHELTFLLYFPRTGPSVIREWRMAEPFSVIADFVMSFS